MSKKVTEDKVAGAQAPKPGPGADGLYGGRWGPGATPTPHNRPGSLASDPASPPRTGEKDPDPPQLVRGADPSRPRHEDEAEMRERREQNWDSEGGASPNDQGGR